MRCVKMSFDREVKLEQPASSGLYCDEKLVDGYVHGTIADNSKGVYFTYVMPWGSTFESPSTDSTYLLAPVCIEAERGWVDLSVEQEPLPINPVHLVPGFNYEMAYSVQNPVSTSFSVIPGAGDGLQPCQSDTTAEAVIRRINGKEANSRGDFAISVPPAECLTVDSRYVDGLGTVRLESHCAPCCRCKDYSDTSAYIKSVAVEYNNAVRKLDELIATYNSVARAFAVRSSCCSAFGSFTPRFRMWPQQNFKLQIQAMAENNTSGRIRMNSMKLVTRITAKNAMSAVDENGQTYSISAGQSLAVIPIADASYLYFKNLNPTSRNIDFRIASQGVIETSVDMVSLPLPSCSAAGDHPNDIEPCTGYAMITAGLVVVDPVFRKIVNINAADAQLDVQMDLTYVGSPAGGDPCSTPAEHPIATSIVRPVKMSPNKKSVNPCPAAKASYLSVGPGLDMTLKFSDSVFGSGDVSVAFKVLVDGVWVDDSSTSVPFSASGQSEVSLGVVPNIPSGVVQATATYSSEGGSLVTKCKAVDASDDEIDIPVASFTVVASFTA